MKADHGEITLGTVFSGLVQKKIAQTTFLI